MRQQRRLPWWLLVAAVRALVREPGLAQSLQELAQKVKEREREQAQGKVLVLVLAQAQLRFVAQWHHRNPELP